ncbi:MAG TPA: hypothetical protein VIX86_24595 [Streptosporangiaceae bacterium]
MRHLIGIILAIVLAAALYLGAGWGVAHITVIVIHSQSLTSTTGLIALAALLGTGLFLGILLAVRAISPLATGLPGLVLLGWTALLVVSMHRALTWVPLQAHSFGYGFRSLLASGALAALGAAMIVPLFIPSRWHGSHVEDGDEDGEDSALPAATGLLS